MAFLDAHPGLGYPAAAGLGLLVGSFLNVVILRLPRRLEWQWKRDAREILEEPELYDPPPPGIVVERSHCPHCGHQLAWYENIPLLSWLALGGKCRSCKAPISFQYPLVELLTALLFAGRAGTALTSEIGLMRATDQLAAMEMMAVDPLRRVVAPRFLGGIIALPLLTAVFNCIGIYGAQLVGVGLMGVESGSFWSQMQSAVDRGDVYEGLVKSLVFGVACSLMAVYQGYHAEPTAAGVGLATTRTVVISAVLTLLLDYMLTAAFL